jgi:ABC-type Zn2+ transport system substrate-binding protein/surface adhesin
LGLQAQSRGGVKLVGGKGRFGDDDDDEEEEEEDEDEHDHDHDNDILSHI